MNRSGVVLLKALQAHISAMAPHQKTREQGKLLLESALEIERLVQLCSIAHDRLLRGANDRELLELLEQGWNDIPSSSKGRD